LRKIGVPKRLLLGPPKHWRPPWTPFQSDF